MKFPIKVGYATIFAIAVFVLSVSAQTGPRVCGDPSAPCKSPHTEFAPYELSFEIPRRIKPNVDYKSSTFYTVVLKTVPSSQDDCDQGEYSSKLERERKQVQTMFPDKKVFASYQCPDMAALSYTINGRVATSTFLAVYGGATQPDAEAVLTKVKSRYRGATVKRMQVVFQKIEQ